MPRLGRRGAAGSRSGPLFPSVRSRRSSWSRARRRHTRMRRTGVAAIAWRQALLVPSRQNSENDGGVGLADRGPVVTASAPAALAWPAVAPPPGGARASGGALAATKPASRKGSCRSATSATVIACSYPFPVVVHELAGSRPRGAHDLTEEGDEHGRSPCKFSPTGDPRSSTPASRCTSGCTS